MSSKEKAKVIEKELQAMGVQAKAYKSDASKLEESEELTKDVV